MLCRCYSHRHRDSLRLEEAFKIIWFNHQPSTTIITPTLFPKVPQRDTSWALPETVTLPPPWATYFSAWLLFQWKNHLDWTSPDATLRPSPLALSLESWQKRMIHTCYNLSQATVESDEVPPEPPPLQTKQLQLLQLLLTLYFPDPSPSWLSFFGWTPAPQCPFWSEGANTERGTWGAASLEIKPL